MIQNMVAAKVLWELDLQWDMVLEHRGPYIVTFRAGKQEYQIIDVANRGVQDIIMKQRENIDK